MLSKHAKTQMQAKDLNGKSDKDDHVPIGSHDPTYIYEVEISEKHWVEAKIISAAPRRSPGYPSSSLLEYPAVLGPDSFRYYVHYLESNRRMDEWIDDPARIRKTDKTVDRHNQEKKGLQDRGEAHHDSSEDEKLTPQKRIEHEEATRIKTVNQIVFGKYRAPTWFFSPLPPKYHGHEVLYFCEYCLGFFLKEEEQVRHMLVCTLVSPPGDMIYSDSENRAIWEVEYFKNQTYIENLGYLAKMYLDHKLLEKTLDLFNFYVLTEWDDTGHHFIGYFSKNREWHANSYNLSCILVLPFFQKKGYGKFLINFSYELAIIEGQIGTPERPLSDFGRQAYHSFWLQRIIEHIWTLNEQQRANLSVAAISKATFIMEADIHFVLDKVKVLKKVGEQYYLCLSNELMNRLYKESGQRVERIDLLWLHWVPFKLSDGRDKR